MNEKEALTQENTFDNIFKKHKLKTEYSLAKILSLKKAIAALTLLLVVLVIIYIYYIKTTSSNLTFLLLSAAFITSISAALLTYLQPSTLMKRYGDISEMEYAYQLGKLKEEIKEEIKEGATANKLITEEDKIEILEKLKNNIESEALGEYQKKLIKLIKKQINLKNHDNHFNQMANRLSSEVQALAKRGNINLLLGITTTLSGLAILGYTVFDASKIKDMTALGLYFLPRISLVILIEVFAYFFLGLYKQNLSEIKYFQNELTNIESKYLSVKLALAEDSTELITSIAEGLLATERNFLLKKGETTVELEKQRMDSSNEGRLGKMHEKLSGVQSSGSES